MLKKNKTLDLFKTMDFPSNRTNKSISIFDDMTILIDRLSNLFKNYINQTKINISENKEIFSFIEKKAKNIQIIVKNIINHNYNLEQLKVLELSVNQIKEKNNYNNLNLFNDEQNLSIFLEETNILFKTIKQKYKIKFDELTNYKNISFPIKKKNGADQNNINSRNSDYNELNEIIKIKNNKRGNTERKRTKSSENKKNLLNVNDMIPTKYREMQNCKSTRNRNKQLDKRDLINLNIPFNKVNSLYNKDIKNDVLLNRFFKNESTKNNHNIVKRNNINKFENNIINDASTSTSANNEKKIENLSKEVLYYKNLVKILSKNKNNINSNNTNGNNDYKLLLEKLKLKEKEIMLKNNKIKILYQEIMKNKNQMNNMNFKINQSEFGGNLNLMNNLKNSDNDDYIQKYKTESNLSNKIKFNSHNSINKEVNHNKNEILNYINRIRYLEKENSIIKSKLNLLNIELTQKIKNFENEKNLFKNEILELKKQIKNEINKNEELNKKNQEENLKYEIELSKINDKRAELSKYLSNKNAEIINLQKELMIKEKDLEKYKEIKDKTNNSNNKAEEKIKEDITLYYKNIIKEKESKELQLNNEINKLNEKKNNLLNQLKIKSKENSELSKNIKNLEIELSKKNEEINNKKKEINDVINKYNNVKKEDSNEYELQIKLLKEENEGLKQFTLKQKKIFIESEKKDILISSLQKEKEALKQYFINSNIPLPPQQKLTDSLKKASLKKDKTFESKFSEEECFNILMQLNDAKKEISIIKKKNEELLNELENKNLKNDCFNHISIDKPLSNYEEEFDLKKMAKGVKEKNRSQDINIDYPGTQQIKEKYRELDFYYNSLEDLVKKLLLSSACTNKNKTYMSELCKIVGFDEDITYKILNNKVKKGILNMFG